MDDLDIRVAGWAPTNVILLLPKRHDHETDEEYQRRCGMIVNVGVED